MFAPAAQSEQLTRELANDLMSPYCPGRTISSCPSGQARKLENFIQDQAEQGKTAEEIETILVARFGRETLGTKTDPILVYGSIGIAVAAGILILVAVKRWLGASSPGGSAAPAAATAAELDDLADALDDLDEF